MSLLPVHLGDCLKRDPFSVIADMATGGRLDPLKTVWKPPRCVCVHLVTDIALHCNHFRRSLKTLPYISHGQHIGHLIDGSIDHVTG